MKVFVILCAIFCMMQSISKNERKISHIKQGVTRIKNLKILISEAADLQVSLSFLCSGQSVERWGGTCSCNAPNCLKHACCSKTTCVSCISFFIFPSEMKNVKMHCIHFSFFCKNEKRMKKFEIQSEYGQNIKKSAIYGISISLICVKSKNKYSVLNFVFQFIKKMKWHFGLGTRIKHTVKTIITKTFFVKKIT